MTKLIDLTKSVYDLVQAYPELVKTMEELGFANITSPAMLGTVGRVMTIPKGAAMRGLDLEKVKDELTRHGFTVL